MEGVFKDINDILLIMIRVPFGINELLLNWIKFENTFKLQCDKQFKKWEIVT